jgi:3-deoxy-D-manno-octulosonic-acid transferase
MFRILYTWSLLAYELMVRCAALFHHKANLWINGRKNLTAQVKTFAQSRRPVVWIHAASLGEFEQGRPVIEALKVKHPENLILLTFFSPSGYEVRKDYPLADQVTYLPLDTPRRMRKFVEAVNPAVLYVIKYDYWFNLFRILYQRKIPIYIVSAIFRPHQHFFRWWGSWFRKELKHVSWFFVQNHESESLLRKAGFTNVSLSGDTRFDRVCRVAAEPLDVHLPHSILKAPCRIVAGSTWPKDEALLLPIIHQHPSLAWIIAPHQPEPHLIQDLMTKLPAGAGRLSALHPDFSGNILVIDSIGILSKLYRFATITYIGGGFGRGIHNLAEAAVYGCPVIFGPNHKIFREAHDLKELGGGFSIETMEQLQDVLDRLIADPAACDLAGYMARNYIVSNQGATAHILSKVEHYSFR